MLAKEEPLRDMRRFMSSFNGVICSIDVGDVERVAGFVGAAMLGVGEVSTFSQCGAGRLASSCDVDVISVGSPKAQSFSSLFDAIFYKDPQTRIFFGEK